MKFFFHTFGCRVNQYDTEKLRESLLRAPGAANEDDFAHADVCVVNTCTVTEEADKDARKLLRQITRRNPSAKLVVTGCLASREPEKLREEFPAAHVVGNLDKDEIPSLLGCSTVAPGFGLSTFHGHSRAFVKVQDGCNMHCTYCIIPEVRPELSCRPYPEVEAEVKTLLANGYNEIVLCGVRLGRYLVWHDDKRIDLAGLTERLMALPGDFRVRYSSLEITDLTDRVITLLAESNGRFCPSFHLPLQSGTDSVLRRMKRWYSVDFYRRRVAALRARVPDAGIFTDVMHGFPGETEAEFEETVAFLKELKFSGLHVFRYSRREGTPAAAEADQVPEQEKRRRADVLHALDKEFRKEFAARAVGTRRRVVVENPGDALTDHFLKVRLRAPHLASGHPLPSGEGNIALAQRERVPEGRVRGLPLVEITESRGVEAVGVLV